MLSEISGSGESVAGKAIHRLEARQMRGLRGAPYFRRRAAAISATVVCVPVSSSFRHRNARAIALTMVLSNRGRGGAQESEPFDAITSLRPPRLRKVRGTRTVRVLPSRLISALDITQPSVVLTSFADRQ